MKNIITDLTAMKNKSKQQQTLRECEVNLDVERGEGRWLS